MGRQKILEPDSVLVKAYVPASVANAIEALASLTGSSKATAMRQIVLLGLTTYEMVSAEATIAAVTTYANTKKTDTKERT